MRNVILILLTLFSGNLFAQEVSESTTKWFQTPLGISAIIAFLALLVCYIIALQKTQKGEMVVFVNKYDFALMFSSYLFVVIAFIFGVNPMYFWVFISLSTAAFITSLIWSILANDKNLKLGILAVFAKFFLMLFVLGILLLYLFTKGVRQTKKTVNVNGQRIEKQLTVYEQMREDAEYEKRKAKALKLISFLLLSLIVGTVAYKNVLKKNNLEEENVNNLIAEIDVKKLLYVFLIAGVLTFSVGYSLGFPNFDLSKKVSKIEQNDLQKEKLQGKVKSVETKTFTAKIKNGKIIKGEQDLFEDNDNKYILYNEEGYIIEEKNNSEGGFKYSYQYDSDGNKIEEYIEDEQGQFYSKKNYKYIGKELQEKITRYKKIGGSKTIYKYNHQGLVSEEIVYDLQGGELLNKFSYKYDRQGRQTEYSVYDSETKKMSVREVYKYLENEISIKETHSNGTVIDIEKFDKTGNIIEYIENDPDGSLYQKTTYQYTFDDRGNIIEINYQYEKGMFRTSKISYQYEYDNQGNYISKILFNENQKPNYIYERKIEYYE